MIGGVYNKGLEVALLGLKQEALLKLKISTKNKGKNDYNKTHIIDKVNVHLIIKIIVKLIR